MKLPAVMSFMCMCVLYVTNKMGELIEKKKMAVLDGNKIKRETFICDYFSYAAKMNGRQSKFQHPPHF